MSAWKPSWIWSNLMDEGFPSKTENTMFPSKESALLYLIARVNMYLLQAHQLRLNAEAKAVIHRWWKLSALQGDTSYTNCYSQHHALANSHQSSQATRPPRVSVTLCISAYCPAPVVCVCCWCISRSSTHCLRTKQEHTILTACWFLWTLQCSLVCFRKDSLPLFFTQFFRIQPPSTALVFSMWFRKPFDAAFIFLLKIHLFISLFCKKLGMALIALNTIAFQQHTNPSSSSADIVQFFVFEALNPRKSCSIPVFVTWIHLLKSNFIFASK